MISPRSAVLTLSLFLLAATSAADELRAQGAPSLPGPGGWAPPSVGVRLGWDQRQREEVVGAHVRLPILPSGELELVGSADVTFLLNLKEYQYNVELIYVIDGRAGGIYGGGGFGMRDTVYPNRVERSTELGYTAVVGFRLVGLGFLVPQVEYRWAFINKAPFTYQNLTIGLSVAPWRHIVRN